MSEPFFFFFLSLSHSCSLFFAGQQTFLQVNRLFLNLDWKKKKWAKAQRNIDTDEAAAADETEER